MGMSGGSNSGTSSSSGYGYSQNLAQSVNASSSNVWGDQAGALKNLYGMATGLAGQQQGAGAAATGLAKTASGTAGAGISALKDLAAGGGPLAQYAQPNNALARQQLDDMSAAIGQNFQRNVMPGIRTGAGSVGGMGGGREAIAGGVAAGDASRSIADAATNLYGQQYAQGAQAAAGVADQRMNAASALGGAATNAFNIGMSPYQAAWGPMSALAGILGGPTVLNQSMGVSQAQGQSENWNASNSTQKGNQWGFNLF